MYGKEIKKKEQKDVKYEIRSVHSDKGQDALLRSVFKKALQPGHYGKKVREIHHGTSDSRLKAQKSGERTDNHHYRRKKEEGTCALRIELHRIGGAGGKPEIGMDRKYGKGKGRRKGKLFALRKVITVEKSQNHSYSGKTHTVNHIKVIADDM